VRIEVKIEPEISEPHIVLHTQKLTPEITALIEVIETASKQSPVLMAKKDDKSFVFDSDSIELIRIEGSVATLYDRQAQGYKIDKPLHEIQQKLGQDFIRISKSAIVNIYRIDHISPSFGGTMDIVMKNGLNDYISRKFLADFKKRLEL
jgi:DNA-binding LytR/AlgR family response regulator